MAVARGANTSGRAVGRLSQRSPRGAPQYWHASPSPAPSSATPRCCLLDEATSALDQTTEAAVNRTLLKLAKGCTMIFSTHRLPSVVEMDEIIVISAGKAIERGSHQELLAKGGVYRKLWDDQGHVPHAAAVEEEEEEDCEED